MGRNKFENQIKEKLEAREIQPSSKSWDRLDAMLSVGEEKKTKRISFFSFQSIGIAASVLVLLSLGLYFFNQNQTISKPEMDVVAKEVINNNDNGKNKFKNKNNDNTNPEITINNNNQVAESSTYKPKTLNNKQQTANNNSSKSFLLISQKTTINSIINQEKLAVISTPEIVVQKENPKVEMQNKVLDSKKVSVNANDLLASVESHSKNANDANKTKIKVDSNSLLSQVDGELDQTFREKVISRISKNYQEVKVALANRNQE